jgi:2-polyprenyl-3-methyl-5-hydroxy-6-metoxy-1,4-benzoquinol methylase
MPSEIKNPLTGSATVELVDTVKSNIIIELYRTQVGVDVSGFFSNITDVFIYKCPVTQYRFYYPATLAGDERFYIEMQVLGERSGQTYYRTNGFDHQFAFKAIADNSEVLEIGTGNGSFMKSLLPKTGNVTGLELNSKVAEMCRMEGLEVFDELIEKHAERKPGFYDVVCSFQVLEHVYEVKEFIQGALAVLKPGGQLIISVPNNEPYHMRYNKYETLNLPPHHIGLWNKESLKNLEKLFPVNLKEVVFCDPHNLKADAYHRVKKWIGSKSLIKDLSLAEKIKIALLLPFSFPLSLIDKALGRIRGSQICVLFEKKQESKKL